MPITKLHAEYAFPACHGRMQELGATLQPLVLETSCNFTGAFDFIVLVVVVTHAHLELLETGDRFVQLTGQIVARLLEIDLRAFRARYTVFVVHSGD